MKKMFIYLGVIAALFAVLFIVNQQSDKAKNAQYADNSYGIEPSKLNVATRNLLSDPNYQNIIVPTDIEQKIKAEDSFFTYFFSPICSFCVATTPQLMPLATDMNVMIHQYNLLEFNEGYTRYNIQFTPTLVYFKDGKEVDRIVGGINMDPKNNDEDVNTLDTFTEFLKKYNAG